MPIRSSLLRTAGAACSLVLVAAAQGPSPRLQQAYIKKLGNPVHILDFGLELGLEDDTLVVGTTNEYVWVMTRVGATWRHDQVLRSSNSEWDDFFGYELALDGDTLVIGAAGEDSNAAGVGGNQNSNALERSGAAFVFVRENGSWVQEAYLKASNPGERDYFGRAVAISGDTIVVGAYAEDSPATGVNGAQGNGLRDSGAAYVFVREGGAWRQEAYLKAPDPGEHHRFGLALAISGDTIAVGVSASSSAYLYERDAAGWHFDLQLQSQGWFSALGASVDVEGDTLAVGDTRGNGSVEVYRRRPGGWVNEDQLLAGNGDGYDAFGARVVLDGDRIVVGALNESSGSAGLGADGDNNNAPEAGAAYLFERSGASWAETLYLKASNPDPGDHFGGSLAIWGDTIVVSATGEESNATGVNGDQSDNSLIQAGAVYVFADELPLGGNYCVGALNSTGRSAWISAVGSPQVSDNALSLHAADLPALHTGVFFYGDTRAQLSLGDGIRCVLNPRMLWAPQRTDAAGRVERRLDFAAPPLAGDILATLPARWYFQFWYRDGTSSNLTDGLQIDLVP